MSRELGNTGRELGRPPRPVTANKLHLVWQPSHAYQGGLLKTTDDANQRHALMHFSGGFYAVPFNRLDEIVFVAGMHGWGVTVSGIPEP